MYRTGRVARFHKLLKLMVRHGPFPGDERPERPLDARIRIAVALQRGDTRRPVVRAGLPLLDDYRARYRGHRLRPSGTV